MLKKPSCSSNLLLRDFLTRAHGYTLLFKRHLKIFKKIKELTKTLYQKKNSKHQKKCLEAYASANAKSIIRPCNPLVSPRWQLHRNGKYDVISTHARPYRFTATPQSYQSIRRVIFYLCNHHRGK